LLLLDYFIKMTISEPSTLQVLCMESIKLSLISNAIPNNWWESNGAFSLLPSEQVQSFLSNSISLKCLNLFRGCDVKDVDLCLFNTVSPIDFAMNIIIGSVLFEVFPLLQRLKLRNSGLTDYGLAHLSSNKYHAICSLDLQGSVSFTSEGLACLMDLKELKSLNISNCKIEINIWQLTQSFETLEIGGNDISFDAMQQIVDSSSKTLEVFTFWGYSNSRVEFSYFQLNTFEKIKTLDLRSVCPLPDFSSGRSVLEANMPVCYLSTLRDLDISFTDADDSTLTRLINLELTSLSLQGTKVSRKSLPTLSQMHSLQSLILSDTHLMKENRESRWSFMDLTSLHVLDLSRCSIDMAIQHRADIISGDCNLLFPPSLRELYLNGCSMISFMDQNEVMNKLNFGAITSSLSSLSSLKVLELSHAMFSASDWTAVLTNKLR
jgi:hypothetical protein